MKRVGLSVGVGMLILALVGCAPEAAPSASPTSAPSEVVSPDPTPSPTPSPEQSEAISLPESCDQVFSPALRQRFEDGGLPLNDPTLTMASTDVAVALEMLATLESLRCTWGVASEVGITTTLALVDVEQRTDLLEAFTTQGLECTEADGAARCAVEVSYDDEESGYTGVGGEIQLVRDGVWVSTKWLNTEMTGYLEDIESTLWP
ncbi:hypothetical protein [Microbacterium sp. NPDC056234]|uniref:hypothetical protein n=1 Tax=Microbacterium sp. NPDC056234 TaxID=3345757 RepID=UPI0035DAF98B